MRLHDPPRHAHQRLAQHFKTRRVEALCEIEFCDGPSLQDIIFLEGFQNFFNRFPFFVFGKLGAELEHFFSITNR